MPMQPQRRIAPTRRSLLLGAVAAGLPGYACEVSRAQDLRNAGNTAATLSSDQLARSVKGAGDRVSCSRSAQGLVLLRKPPAPAGLPAWRSAATHGAFVSNGMVWRRCRPRCVIPSIECAPRCCRERINFRELARTCARSCRIGAHFAPPAPEPIADARFAPAARRHHRARFRADLSGALRDPLDGEGRRRRHQDRAAIRRAAAPPRRPGDKRDPALRDRSTRTSAR